MDEGGLLRMLRANAGAAVEFAVPPAPISGGFWATIVGVELRGAPPEWSGPLVVRLMPGLERARREIVIQRTVASAGFETPRVLAAGVDESLGAYLVMPRVSGGSPLRSLRDAVRLPKLLAGVSARLHALDPAPLAAALEEAGVSEQWTAERIRRDEVAEVFPELDAWFEAHRPPTGTPVICHGDLHPFNLLVDTGTVTLLDWTNAQLARRELDLGFTAGLLRCAPGVPAAVTGLLAERFLARARREGAIDRAAVEWYEALQHARALAEIRLEQLAADHPFVRSAPAMRRRLRDLTGITAG